MAWQQASVCLLVSFLSAVVRGYGLYPGTLPDRLYRGFRIGFRHLYPGHVDVQAMVCTADVPVVGHGNLLARFCLPIGKTLPPRWQNFAIGMAKVCQGQGKWLAKFLADRQ